MATNTTINSEFIGKVAGDIIGQTFKEADTIAKGLVTMFPNVNSPVFLRKFQYTDGTTDYSCGHNPDGAFLLEERELFPKKVKNDFSICKEDFRMSWDGDAMGASAHNLNLPKNITEAIQLEVLSSTAERIGRVIWGGDNSVAGEWNGFIRIFENDANIIKAGAGPASPTNIPQLGEPVDTTNIMTILDRVSSYIPTRLRRKKLAFTISPDVADAYTKYLITQGAANGLGGNANTNLVYGRYELMVNNDLPDNTFLVYEPKNLVFGTGLSADFNQLILVDEDSIGLISGLIRGKMVYSGGCQYYNSEDIVYFLSTSGS